MFDCIIFTDFTDTVLVQKTLGAYKVAHQLREHGYQCLVVDHFHTYDINEVRELLDLCMTVQTRFVGFSTTFFQKLLAPVAPGSPVIYGQLNISESFCPQGPVFEKQLLDLIRTINPDCKIVVGGTKTQQSLNNRNIDYAVLGHAEISAVRIMDHLAKHTPLENSSRNLWGIIEVNDAEARHYDFSSSSMSWLAEDVINAKVLPLETARGCIFNCKFCGYPMRGKKNLDYVRNAESLRIELEANWRNHGIRTYSLMDDTFNDNDAKLDLILSAVERLDFQPEFWCYARLDLLCLKPDRLEKMMRIGVRSMFLGIETLNNRTGQIVGKGHDRLKQIETLRRIRDLYQDQILLHGSFIIGLPEESIQSVEKTFHQLMDGTIPLHSFRFSPLRIARNRMVWPSEFDLDPSKYGYRDLDPALPLELDWANDHMTRQQAIDLSDRFHQQAERSDNYYVPSQTAWSLLNYGYDLKELCSLRNSQLDWHRISQQKTQFTNSYKQKLLDHLKGHHVH